MGWGRAPARESSSQGAGQTQADLEKVGGGSLKASGHRRAVSRVRQSQTLGKVTTSAHHFRVQDAQIDRGSEEVTVSLQGEQQ